MNQDSNLKSSNGLDSSNVEDDQTQQSKSMADGRPRIAKTMLDQEIQKIPKIQKIQEIQEIQNSPTMSAEAKEAGAPLIRRHDRPEVPKTMLDHAMYDELFKSSYKKEETSPNVRPNLPPHQLQQVRADKYSLECPWKWSETDAADRVRLCQKCQTPVYNFDGVESKDADAMIFARENQVRDILFSRSDGKFMTRNCQAAVKSATNKLTAYIAGFILFIVCAFLAITWPKPQLPPTTNVPTGHAIVPKAN